MLEDGSSWHRAFKYLQDQNISEHNIHTLDLSQNRLLNTLHCFECDWSTNLDVSSNVALTILCCSYSNLSQLNLTNNTALQYLDCSFNVQLAYLDISNNTALESIDISCNNQLTEICVWTVPFPPDGVEVGYCIPQNHPSFTTDCN